MTTLLAARNLSAGYGTIPVLTDLDLHVDGAEIVALMGSYRATSGSAPARSTTRSNASPS